MQDLESVNRATALGGDHSSAAANEADWHPLFTDAEWKDNSKQQEFRDGLVHFFNKKSFLRRREASDGALRARVTIRGDGTNFSLVARRNQQGGQYSLTVVGKAVTLDYNSPGMEPETIGRYHLSEPQKPNSGFSLELRLKGDNLTGLFNGAVVVEAQDDRVSGSGDWGIYAKEGWFESVEVRD
jgi:hypothetical protein